jgi:hypothetical protein
MPLEFVGSFLLNKFYYLIIVRDLSTYDQKQYTWKFEYWPHTATSLT